MALPACRTEEARRLFAGAASVAIQALRLILRYCDTRRFATDLYRAKSTGEVPHLVRDRRIIAGMIGAAPIHLVLP
jgi:hypothetical protein